MPYYIELFFKHYARALYVHGLLWRAHAVQLVWPASVTHLILRERLRGR
jgi:G:T-mismatch repair DNA endonuclease (very short patch repair protein)